MKRILPLLLLLLTTALPVHSQNKTYRLLLHWYPQAQFAGYYYALEKGYYQEEDLDIDIIHGTVSIPSTRILKTGDFECV